jgi:hypothetical protein
MQITTIAVAYRLNPAKVDTTEYRIDVIPVEYRHGLPGALLDVGGVARREAARTPT